MYQIMFDRKTCPKILDLWIISSNIKNYDVIISDDNFIKLPSQTPRTCNLEAKTP